MIPAIAIGALAVALGAASLRRADWTQVACYVLSICAAVTAVVCAMGRPVPLWAIVPRLGNVALIAMVSDEPRAIYLLIKRDSERVPLVVQVPWSERQASNAHDALERARLDHTQARWAASGVKQMSGSDGVGTQHNGASGGAALGNSDGVFYATAQSPLPPKHGDSP